MKTFIIRKTKLMTKTFGKILINGLIFVCLFISCKKGIPGDVIQPAKMESLLYDYHMAKAMANELPYGEKYKQPLYIEYVLKKHDITQAQLDSSMVWYTRHTEELSKIYENINKRYKKEQNNINHLIAVRDNKPKETLSGDSIDIWYGNRLYMLTNSQAINKLTFNIPSDMNFKEFDRFVWKMRNTFIPIYKKQQDTAVIAIYAKYDNDTIIPQIKQITGSGIDSLVLKCDSAYKLKEIKGFIYYAGNKKDKALLIDNISLIRYHQNFNDSLQINGDSIDNKIDSLSSRKPIYRHLQKKAETKISVKQ